MKIDIRDARSRDESDALALMPALADFTLPPTRVARHLWEGDAKQMQRFFAGDAPNCFLKIAAGDDGKLLGLGFVTMREELLSKEPSAHLEAIVVSDAARGCGAGRALLRACEQEAKSRGALSLTLTAFNLNVRARGLYESEGYDPELIRYTKPL